MESRNQILSAELLQEQPKAREYPMTSADLEDRSRERASVRIDKWLWAARFFKTRALASKACELGRITSNGQTAKAAREVKAGDALGVKNEGGEFQIEVLAISDVRGPAAVAQQLYRETDASRALRAKVAEERKAMRMFEPIPEAKPSKRDRRRIVQFRERN